MAQNQILSLISSRIQFSNLCGTVYKGGNLCFSADGRSVLSPVGNRVSVFNLVENTSYTLPFENRKDVSRIAVSPDGNLLVSVDLGWNMFSLTCVAFVFITEKLMSSFVLSRWPCTRDQSETTSAFASLQLQSPSTWY